MEKRILLTDSFELSNATNKTGHSSGYITIYGDLSGLLRPIGDLTRPEVTGLARWLPSTRR